MVFLGELIHFALGVNPLSQIISNESPLWYSLVWTKDSSLIGISLSVLVSPVPMVSVTSEVWMSNRVRAAEYRNNDGRDIVASDFLTRGLDLES